MSATLLGVFLAFFPVAVGALRGLQSTPPASVELMDSLASPWWRTLLKLRFPAAVPYLAPALRIAGSLGGRRASSWPRSRSAPAPASAG